MSKTFIKTDGYCINKLIEKVKSKIGDKAAEQLKQTAIEIVQNCVDFYSETFGSGDVGAKGTGHVSNLYKDKIPNRTTGLIYGRVQSGKTNTTIATLGIAQENKFRCFIVLTSDNTWLGKQTANRFNNQLKGGPVVFDWEQWKNHPKDFAQSKLLPSMLVLPKSKFVFMFNYSNEREEVDNDLNWQDAEEIDEHEWLHAAASNPVFDFLKDPVEDIYTLADGKPFNDER